MSDWVATFAFAAQRRAVKGPTGHTAVHETAAKDYVLDIRRSWSPPVTSTRIDQYRRDSLHNETTLVADVHGAIARFGVIVESNN
jgi:hypothetical protein